jgi:hypothetical protein
MATKKVKVVFEPMTATQEHTMRLTEIKYDVKGNSRIVPKYEGLPMQIVFKKGDSYEFDKEIFDELVLARQVRNKAQMKQKEQLIRDKAAIYEMVDSERALMLTDLPYEV